MICTASCSKSFYHGKWISENDEVIRLNGSDCNDKLNARKLLTWIHCTKRERKYTLTIL